MYRKEITTLDKSFKNYESNYIQIYYDLNWFERIVGMVEYTFLDHIGASHKFYGYNKLIESGVKVKVINEMVVEGAPQYKFYTIKIPVTHKSLFTSIMQRLTYHMYKKNDKEYFDILNRYLVHQWVEGKFKDDPDSTNLDRINRSLKASKVVDKDNVLPGF